MAPAALAGAIGPTPLAAALADTKKFAQHEVRAVNRPGVSYTVGTCTLLHRKPWLAYTCTWELHGTPGECVDRITVAVKRLASGMYLAGEVGTKIQTYKEC